MRVDQAAGALRNVAVTKAVNIDKAPSFAAAPTELRAHIDVTDILRRLSAQGVIEI